MNLYNRFIHISLFITLSITFLVVNSSSAQAGYFEQGRMKYVYRKYDEAKVLFLKAVEQNDNGNAYYFLGEIEKNKGNYDKAIEYFASALKKRTSAKYLKLAYWNVIILTEQRGNYEELVRICKHLYIRLKDRGAKSKVESIINKLLWTDNKEAKKKYHEGIKYKNSGKGEEAKKSFNAALQVDGSFLAPRFELGLAAYKKGNFSDALYNLKTVSSRIPFYGEVHLLLGDIYFQQGRSGSAIYHLEKALEFGFLDKTSIYLSSLKIATSYYKSGNYDSAMEYLAQAVKQNSSALEPLLLLSAIKIKRGEYDSALETLIKAQQISSNNKEIIFQIGSIYYHKKDSRAGSYFEKLYSLRKASANKTPSKYLKAYALLAEYYYKKGKYSAAVAVMDYLPQIYLSHDMKLKYARAQFRLGNLIKAKEQYERLHSLDNDDTYRLMVIHARNGERERAKKMIIKYENNTGLIEKVKKEPVLNSLLAEIIKERKEKEEEEKRKALERQKELERQKALEHQKEIERQKALEREKALQAEKKDKTDTTTPIKASP